MAANERISLSGKNVALVHRFMALLSGLLADGAVQTTAPATRRRRVRRRVSSPAHPADELLLLPSQVIPETHFRHGARLAFKVLTDAMNGARLLEGHTVFVRPAATAADGDVVVCRLDGVLYLKRLERRGRQKTLISANVRYPVMTVRRGDDFVMIGVVTR